MSALPPGTLRTTRWLPARAAGGGAASLYCPSCLRRVRPRDARRRPYVETCDSGPVPSLLVCCPACDLVLSAEAVCFEGSYPRA